MNTKDNYLKNRLYQDLGLSMRPSQPVVPTHFKVVVALVGISLVGFGLWELTLQSWWSTFGAW